jgi:diadenosine tetraphosphate (Ap4A) HIT family hydrolase
MTVNGCPFCTENGHVDILARGRGSYLIQARRDGNVMEGCYLIIPYAHAKSIAELPLNFLDDLVRLMPSIPEVADGAHPNIVINQGRDAGQRIEHVHAWITVRQPSFYGSRDTVGFCGFLPNWACSNE